MITIDTPRIYVADLAAYNNGVYHGIWIDATEDVDSIRDQINEMLKNSPEDSSEEFSIHDFENFGDYKVEEYSDIEILHEVAAFIQEHNDVAIAALSYTSELDEAKEMVDERYHGCYDSEEEFAEQLYDDCYTIPEHLQYYIDYKKIARDLFMDGYFSVEAPNGEIHVFSN